MGARQFGTNIAAILINWRCFHPGSDSILVLAKYFNAHLHLANWVGHGRPAFRFPKGSLDAAIEAGFDEDYTQVG